MNSDAEVRVAGIKPLEGVSMRSRSLVMIGLAVAFGATMTSGQETTLNIRLANGTEREAATKSELEAIVAKYDLDHWVFTQDIVIDAESIPHSHPVLTLHTRHLGDEPALLATFLHEQFHWLEEERPAAREAAVAEFRARFPDVPFGRPNGGRDAYSTYLHLIVCDLEYAAVSELLGQAAAHETLSANTHYVWIYRQVLENPAIRAINSRHDFDLESIPR